MVHESVNANELHESGFDSPCTIFLFALTESLFLHHASGVDGIEVILWELVQISYSHDL